MKLETTTAEQKRTAYDSLALLGDIGGLIEFIVIVVTPVVAIIVGDKMTYHLLSKLFMVNNGDPKGDKKAGDGSEGSDNDDDNNNSDIDAQKKRWKKWMKNTVPYKTDART